MSLLLGKQLPSYSDKYVTFQHFWRRKSNVTLIHLKAESVLFFHLAREGHSSLQDARHWMEELKYFFFCGMAPPAWVA